MSSTIRISSNQLLRDRQSNSTIEERVANFSIEVLGTVQVSTNAGGPGLLLKLKRYPDNKEKYVL